MRTAEMVTLAAVAALPAMAAAQSRPVAEFGTSAGLSIQHASGTTVTYFGAPGAGILGQPTLYASIFSGQRLMLEPQVALNIISSGGNTATTVGLAGGVGYLFKGPSVNSGFAEGVLAYQSLSGGGFSNHELALGGRLGYRILAGTSLGVRFEAGYRRWFDAHLNEFTLGIGLGGVLHAAVK